MVDEQPSNDTFSGVHALPTLQVDCGSDEPVEFLHQIFITKDGCLPEVFPPSIEKNTKFLRYIYPQATYKIYSGNDVREILKNNFSPNVLEAYDTLVPFAYKCDLARLCVLYLYGGLYVDLGVRIFFPLEISDGTEMLLFRCPLHRENHAWDVENSIIFSRAHRPELKVAIDLICANVERRFYGVNTLAPTGPGVIGRAIAIVGDEEAYQMGFSSISNTQLNVNFFNYILPSGKFVATRTKDGRLNVVVQGANDYNDYWHARLMYGENIFFPKSLFSYKADTSDNSISEGGQVSSSSSRRHFSLGSTDCVIWGPRKFVPYGRYLVRIVFSADSIVSGLRIDFFDIGLGCLHEEDVEFLRRVSEGVYEIDFFNPFDSRLFEVRFHSDGRAVGNLVSVELAPLPLDAPKTFFANQFLSPAREVGTALRSQQLDLSSSKPACVMWGPRKFLARGRYNVHVTFSENSTFQNMSIDFFDYGVGVLHEIDLEFCDPIAPGVFLFDFFNPFDLRLFELRVHCRRGSSRGSFLEACFVRISDHAPVTYTLADFLFESNECKLISQEKRGLEIRKGFLGLIAKSKGRVLLRGEFELTIYFRELTQLHGLVVELADPGIGVVERFCLDNFNVVAPSDFRFRFVNRFDLRLFEIRVLSDGSFYGRIDSIRIQLVEN